MLNTPFSPWPVYAEDEVAAVAGVLQSGRVNYWTGELCRRFESEFADWVGVPHAVSLANGTVALDVALKALGIGPSDEVVVTPRSFIASVSSVVLAGATPVFADVDSESQNISAETIRDVLTDRTRAIVCVHLAGWPCEMDAIMKLASERGLWVIEDCAQAHGARYKGRMVGSIGHIGAWSFCQDKIMSTGGEGGMVTTSDRALWEKMWSFKDHGKSWDAVFNRVHQSGFRWLHESFGTNWRMLEVQAAIGRLQLRKMSEWTAARTNNAMAIAAELKRYAGLRVPFPAGDVQHAFYRLYAFVRPEYLAPGWTRDRIIEEVQSRGVPCYQGSCPEIYREKAFEGTGFDPKRRLPTAQQLGETSLMLLVHPTLTPREIDSTTSAFREVLSSALLS